jgi:hypothetical protein
MARERLYDDEAIQEVVEWDGATVVVTSHRVLAFTPDLEGANFAEAEKPNVEGVDTDAQSSGWLVERGFRYGVYGFIMLGTAQFVDFGSLLGGLSMGQALSGGGASAPGLGGVTRIMGRLTALMRSLDEILQTAGALVLLGAVAMVAVYWYTRDPTLAVRVAGGDDIHLPRPDEATGDRLTHLLTPEGGTDDGLTDRLGL